MGKNYDVYVTPQNTPRFRERKIIFAAAMGLQTLNWALLAYLLAEVRTGMIIMALLTLGFTVIQSVERRKAMWTWGYILGLCAAEVLLAACFSWTAEIYWFLALLGAEIAVCAGLAAVLLRPKHGKWKSAGRK